LLRDMLNRHPHIRIPSVETEFLPWMVRQIGPAADLSHFPNFQRFYSQIVRFPYFTYKAAEGRVPSVNHWYSACQRYDAAGLFEALVRLDLEHSSIDHVVWGDKSPSYVEHIPLIASLYPAARFIHIIRDVRDYCLSIHQAWHKDMLRAAQRWIDSIEATQKAGHSLSSAYMEIRYEDLLLDAEMQLRRACQFVEVEFDTAMLSLERPSENIGDAKGVVGILSSNVRKYVERMSPDMLSNIEAVTGEALLACGYPLSYPLRPRRRLSNIELLSAQLRDGCNLVLSARKEWGFVGATLFYWRYFRATRAI
jgi:hypothetical protein